MPRGRRRRRGVVGDTLGVVRAARKAAADALRALRAEIDSVKTKLEALVTEQKAFAADLFGGGGTRGRRGGRPGRPPGRVRQGAARRRGPAKAMKFFARLPARFTLDEVRKVAGRLAGVSLAQWSRAKRIQKTAAGYVKTAVAAAGPAPAKKRARARKAGRKRSKG